MYPEPLNSLELAGVGFLQRVSARETLLGLRSVREIGGMPFVTLRSHTVPAHKVRLKRIFDLVVTIVDDADLVARRGAGRAVRAACAPAAPCCTGRTASGATAACSHA